MNANLLTLQNTKPKVIAIVGPTAGGKTAFSIELAKKIGGEIVSADSRLVYKGFDIGTAKPTIEERDGVPHHLIDIAEPEFEYSAGLYKENAKKIISEILQRGNVPIIVGGTGLYLNILLKNYDLPGIVANKELREELNKFETEKLYERLGKLDPEALNIINYNDRKKIIRAIEIITESKMPLSAVRSIGSSEYDVKWIGKNFDRNVLYNRINKRVDVMIDCGLVEETSNLLKKHGRIPNLVNTIGYREILGYLDNIMSLEEAAELLKKNTRNYAKRQLTWFRKNKDIEWDVYPQILKK